MAKTSKDIYQQLTKKRRIEDTISIKDIPTELLLMILNFTKSDPQKLAELGSVSKLWHQITQESSLLKTALSQLSDEKIFSLFENTGYKFTEIIEIQDEYADADEEKFQEKISEFHYKTFPQIERKIEILLHDPRITIDTRYGENKQTLCHLAAKLRLEYMINWLQRQGADLNAANKNGETPLHVAFQNIEIIEDSADFDIARELLKYEVNVNIQDKLGATPLHCLAKFEYVEQLSDDAQEDFKNFLNELAEKGADFKIKDRLTYSAPWQVAAAKNNLKLNYWLNELTQKQIAKQQEEMDNTVISSMSMR